MEPSPNVEQRSSTPFERHLQTGISVVITAVLIAVLTTVQDTSERQGVLETNVIWMTKTMESMQDQLDRATNGRYTQNDAVRDRVYYDKLIGTLTERVTDLESRAK